MPNPNPKMSPEFLAKMNPKIEGVELAKPIGVRFPVEDLEFLNSLPDRGQFIRDAVREAIAKAKQVEEPSTPTATPEKKSTGRKPKTEVMPREAIATCDAASGETIEGLGLSVRTYNKWKQWCVSQEINTVGELIKELKSIPQCQVVEDIKGIGDSSVKELSEALKKFDFEWK